MSHLININGKEITVEQYKTDWVLALMNKGVIVNLSISKWSGTTGLTANDLGLKFIDDKTANMVKKYINLGRQKLFPPEEMAKLNYLCVTSKDVLDNYSFDTVWGKFVPFTAFAEWEQENEIQKRQYLERAKYIDEKYDEIVAQVKESYKQLGRDVWFRLHPESKGEPTAAFIEDFASRVVLKIPSRENLAATYKYDVEYFIIPMPSFMEENIAVAERIKLNTEREKNNAEIEIQTRKRISEEYIKRKSELIDGFLNATVVSMRKYLSDLCTSILNTMGQRKRVNQVTNGDLNRLKNMIKKVKLLNFYDDREISDLMNMLEIEVSKANIKGEMKEDRVVDKLKKIVEVAQKEFLPPDINPAISLLEI